MPAPEIIHHLVQQFQDNRDAYRSGQYNEAQLRQEFLNPFFEALGWDVANRKGFSINYREVVHEDSIHIKGSPHAKAPDYAFRLGGVRKFFVEAKKPAEDIQNDRELAYQLKVYAWNVGLPLSILTDFEEFAVYDCRNKPNPTDSPAAARILYLNYQQFIEKWEEIENVFSPLAIQKGAFDRYASETTSRKGTTKVDDAFLADIEQWRTLLARNIALRNEHVVNERQLNYAVQMTIDRIIFLRICEDRGIEPENQLLEMSKQRGIYPQLVALYQRADIKYNSGLFHFKQEKGGSERIDKLTPTLEIDDKVLKEIIKDLYYPCPYIFKEIPVEILGQVYEQFLGKVIRLTPGRQAKIEEKPEVRKAGGVYYTPSYIVDYIVQNTVSKLVEGRTPEQVSQLKIVDPACGSGSFLLGAFQYLLDWHESWYLAYDPAKWAKGKLPALIPTADGGWKLTTAEKKRILVNNIYGVDIDAQAVEVTKLSLLLKVLEEESGQLSLGLERVLPDLSDNIKCGNSLIGWDYFEGQLIPDEKEIERVNPFDWQRNFPQVFAQGGFDAVIGNPPYIRIQAMKEWAPNQVRFYKTKYIAASKGNYDIYVVFVEVGLQLLSQSGLLGYIIPHKFFNAQYGESLRTIIYSKLMKIVNFGYQQVFSNATTYSCLIFISKNDQTKFEYVEISNIQDWILENKEIVSINDNTKLGETSWVFGSKNKVNLYSKLNSIKTKLADVTDRIFQGIKTSADKIFIVEEIEKKEKFSKIYSYEKDNEYYIEKDLLHPLIKGGNSKRYKILPTSKLLIFPYKKVNETSFELISKREMKEKFPMCWNYLLENKSFLESRENGRMSGDKWYGYIYPKNFSVISNPKIFTPDIAPLSSFSLDIDGSFYFTGGAAGGYGILVKNEYSRNYILGILNSKVLEWFLHQYSTPMRGGWFSYESRYIQSLPIYKINFANPKEVEQHDRMVSLVERMLDLHKRESSTPQEAESIKRQIAATDAAIDKLVYELYGLTDEEIKIVEGEL